MKSNIKVGIVGIGRTGSEHLNFYLKEGNFQIYLRKKEK